MHIFAVAFFLYKIAAENKLKTERKRHEQQEHELQRQAQVQTELKERSLQEANLKFTSLQQHYKLLKSQLEDFKEESSKSKTTQAQKITLLENQIKELQKTKDNGSNVWKVWIVYNLCRKKIKIKINEIQAWYINYLYWYFQTKYTELLNEKIALEQTLAEWHQKKETSYAGENGEPANPNYKRLSTVPSSHKNFNSQVAVNDNLYEISIKYSNDSKTAENGEKVKNDDVDKKSKKSQNPNSTENVNVALKANNLAVTPSTSTRSQKLLGSKSKMLDAKKENILWPIEQLAEPSTIAAQIKAVAQNNRKPVKLPHGVVPFQNNLDAIQLYDDHHNNKVNSVENNRYSNIINEAVEENEPKHGGETSNELQNINADSDTGAHEENDSNEHNNHMQKPLRHQTNDVLNNKNAELNVKLNNENNVENSLHIANDEDLQIPLKGDKLKNEVNDDQGKAYPDEVNFQVEDEDGKHTLFVWF